METKAIIEKLCELGERQLGTERKAKEIITSILDDNNITFQEFEFQTQVPNFKEYSLEVDGEKIECLPSGLISGKIISNDYLISSLTSSQDFLYKSNLNFNPKCSAISVANYYFAPSLAIAKKDLLKVCDGKEIKGNLVVEKTEHNTSSILVGNTKNPKNILFSHFDSIEVGAIDNASGTAVMLSLLLRNSKFLETTLFVFDPNEEVSYDEPIYWGRGYREFEKEYFSILENAQKILVVDCVGYSPVEKLTNPSIAKLAFPIVNAEKLKDKISIVCGDYDKLMKVYQSPIDLPQGISENYLNETLELLEKEITSFS